MCRARTRSRPLNGHGWRLFLVYFALAAFALQSYLTQTHIHFPAQGTAGSSLASALKPLPSCDKSRSAPCDHTPAGDDTAKCPLCQAMGYAGQFVTPANLSFILPPQAVSVVSLAPLVFAGPDGASHNWQGRAPPGN